MFDPQHSYTLEEYWKLVEVFPEHKYEYIDGAIRMMTGGSLAHAQIGANIAAALVAALRKSECNVYGSDGAVQLMGDKCYYPDVSVSCDPRDWTRTKALEAPTVVVEVLSPSTEHIDKVEKLKAYQNYPTIQEILLVDSRRCYVEHYHRDSEFRWTLSIYKKKNDAVFFSSIDVCFTVDDIYAKVFLELEEE